MNNKEKENREYEEFLKFYEEQYGAKHKAPKTAPAASQLPQTNLNQPQEKMNRPQERPSQPQQQTANRTNFKKSKISERCPAGSRRQSGTTRAAAPTNAAQPLQRPGVAPKNLPQQPPRNRAAKKRRQRQVGLLLGLALAAVLLVGALVALFAPSKTDVLKGTWNLDGVTVYQFNGKGTGSLNLPESSYAFTYKIQGNTLAIDFKDETAQDKTYTFTAEKNKLTLTGSAAEGAKVFVLTKQGE